MPTLYNAQIALALALPQATAVAARQVPRLGFAAICRWPLVQRTAAV